MDGETAANLWLPVGQSRISIFKITVLRSDHSVSGPYATGPVNGFEINTYTSVRMSFTSPKYFLVVVIVYIQHKFLFLLKTWKA